MLCSETAFRGSERVRSDLLTCRYMLIDVGWQWPTSDFTHALCTSAQMNGPRADPCHRDTALRNRPRARFLWLWVGGSHSCSCPRNQAMESCAHQIALCARITLFKDVTINKLISMDTVNREDSLTADAVTEHDKSSERDVSIVGVCLKRLCNGFMGCVTWRYERAHEMVFFSVEHNSGCPQLHWFFG